MTLATITPTLTLETLQQARTPETLEQMTERYLELERESLAAIRTTRLAHRAYLEARAAEEQLATRVRTLRERLRTRIDHDARTQASPKVA